MNDKELRRLIYGTPVWIDENAPMGYRPMTATEREWAYTQPPYVPENEDNLPPNQEGK